MANRASSSLALLICSLLLIAAGAAYLDGPPAGRTGGFGEPTCIECHFDGLPNEPGGLLAIEGLPAAHQNGTDYPLTVRLHRPGMVTAGFQLSARFEDGTQAGTLMPVDASTERIYGADSIQYLQHTRLGHTPAYPDSARWSFVWQAPSESGQMVLFHLAANAGNGDESPFGDYINLHQTTSTPSTE